MRLIFENLWHISVAHDKSARKLAAAHDGYYHSVRIEIVFVFSVRTFLQGTLFVRGGPDYLFDKDDYSENQRGNAKARNVDSVVADDGRRKNYGKKHRNEQRS